MVAEILVQVQEMLAAVNDMNKAMEIYRDAVEQCKSAAEDLASKWEGEAKDAFVEHQEYAYSWYMKMLQVVLNMIDVIRKVIDAYEQMESTAASQIHT